jgi:hypothetical protein
VATHTLAKLENISKPALEKHIADTFHNNNSKSTIAEHSHNSKHLIFLDQSIILTLSPYYSSHIIREALKIEKHPNNFN